MKCNIIAQRISLQEHLLKQADDILKQIDDLQNNEEEAKNLRLDNAQQDLFGPWLEGFRLENPSDYFKNQPDNVDLVCNTQTEFEFLIKTLELFGLPQEYMLGHGHWALWTKESAEGKNTKNKKGKKEGKKKIALTNLQRKMGVLKEEVKRPTHFDLVPF